MIYTKRNSTTKRDNSNFHILEWHHYKLLIYFEGLFMKEIINTMSKYLIKLEQCLVDFNFQTKNKEPFLTCSENGPNLIKFL